ncbi:DUF45 domain-containing protein [Candidatus Gracilibacteria bacterium]|nr:DUF45 domain-containing protein [Candidatus Gracilibacteria bacterium]
MKYPVEIHESKSRTSSVRLRAGKVVIRFSRHVRGRERDKMMEKFMKWAEKKLSEISADFVLPEYRDGGRIVTHNKNYELSVMLGNKRNRVDLRDGGVMKVFLVVPDDKKLKDLVEKKIMQDQQEYLEEVLSELNQLHFQQKYNDVKWKRTCSRFGSCSSKRNINIAYRLLFAPREVFRYVCVHELAHLKEFNHSKRFWDLVEEAMPKYKESEKWLKENGFALG